MFGSENHIKIAETCFATKLVVQTQLQFRRGFPGRNAPTRLNEIYTCFLDHGKQVSESLKKSFGE